MIRRPFAVLGLCFAVGFIAGCGDAKPGGEPSPVSGTVTIDGKAAANIQVQFVPDPSKGGKGTGASGVTDADGKYTLKTADGRPGAAVGSYLVALTDLDVDRVEQGVASKPSRIPAQYQSTSRSPLKVEVVAGQNDIPLPVIR